MAELHEACGVFGIFAPGVDVARITFFGLYALQHRGQESAGITTGDGKELRTFKSMGLVVQVFNEEELGFLKGHVAIGHTRYSTTGGSKVCNAQPIVVDSEIGQLALGHNGNLVNTASLAEQLLEMGQRLDTSTDSELIAKMISSAPGLDWESRILHTLPRFQGAYSLVMASPDTLFAARDPLGVRPLCLGEMNGGWVVASETCALDTVGATFVREVEPGELLVIDAGGVRSVPAIESQRRALCIFEFIYFARPDSTIDGQLVYQARQEMGRHLAREYPVDADLVIPVPDSAIPAATGYAQESGIHFGEGLIKNRYIGRTFIQPDQRLRQVGVRLKFNPLPEMLSGKRVVVVDDSIVRGTTTPPVIGLLRKAGAKEVHMRICAPPMRFPCYLGVDTARQSELIAARMSVEEIRRHIGADSLGYLSLEGLLDSVGKRTSHFCRACFTGNYPVPIQLEMDKLILEV
ncbi:MAG: amidophosphoribosyltransferase [Sphingomonadaceae bacterium]